MLVYVKEKAGNFLSETRPFGSASLFHDYVRETTVYRVPVVRYDTVLAAPKMALPANEVRVQITKLIYAEKNKREPHWLQKNYAS
jgi:hypothetical protein